MTAKETKIEQLMICRNTATLVHNYMRMVGDKIPSEFISDYYTFTKEIDTLLNNSSNTSDKFWQSVDIDKYATSEFFKECCQSDGLSTENVDKLKRARPKIPPRIFKGSKSVTTKGSKSDILSYIIQNNITNRPTLPKKALETYDYTPSLDSKNVPQWVSEEIPD